MRVLIADDEEPARDSLRLLLEADPGVELVRACSDGPETVAAILETSPDLVFLDVQMPGMDGFQVLDRVGPERMPLVVFVTAYSSHAIRAFEVHALDYLLKPFDDERFARTLAHAKGQIRQAQALDLARRLAGVLEAVKGPSLTPLPGTMMVPPAEPHYLERITIRNANRMSFLPVAEIEWIEAQDYYAEIHAGDQEHLVREPLKELEDRLDPHRFVRIHRSIIVNLAFVDSLVPDGSGSWTVVMKSGARLKSSRAYRDRLRNLLEG
jgi:two-component system LytT family response regulator